jgi:tryptophan-rich sensory protein
MGNKFGWKVLILSILIVYLVAFIGSVFTSQNTNSDWYKQNKPSITPPNYVFPIVWNFLFLLIAFSLALAWISSNKKEKKKVAWIFGINFLLNILWSIFYFSMKNPLLAFFDLTALWISIILVIYITYKINRKSAYLLIPYLLWVTFAGVLNYLTI